MKKKAHDRNKLKHKITMAAAPFSILLVAQLCMSVIYDEGPSFLEFLLIIAAVLILMLPSIIVQFFDLRVKNPKPVFVEPTQKRMALFIFPWLIVTFFAMAPVAAILGEDNTGWTLGIWVVVAVFLPLNIYMVNAYTRYKRVAEYGTNEWKRLRKKSASNK